MSGANIQAGSIFSIILVRLSDNFQNKVSFQENLSVSGETKVISYQNTWNFFGLRLWIHERSLWSLFSNLDKFPTILNKYKYLKMGEGISLAPHHHFHPLHRHLDNSRETTEETQWADSNREPLVSEYKPLIIKLPAQR